MHTFLLDRVLQQGALHIDRSNPYTISSGIQSPVYFDARKLLISPVDRRLITLSMQRPTGIVCGIATGGIPWGMMLAETYVNSYVTVRAEPKGHGLEPGPFNNGIPCIFIEDTITTGETARTCIETLRTNIVIDPTLQSIFSYDFEATTKMFEQAGIPFSRVIGFNDLLLHALKGNFISNFEFRLAMNWWNKTNQEFYK